MLRPDQQRNLVILITSIVLMIILVSIFVLNYGKAQDDIKTERFDCTTKCGSIITNGFNYNNCEDLRETIDVTEYLLNCNQECRVTVRGGIICILKQD